MLFLERSPQVGVDLEVRLLRIERRSVIIVVVHVPLLPDPLLLFPRNLFLLLPFESEGPVDKLLEDVPVAGNWKDHQNVDIRSII